jgi:hypothetical protein
VFDENGSFKTGGRELLKQKMTGYVSYVRGENPYKFVEDTNTITDIVSRELRKKITENRLFYIYFINTRILIIDDT